MDTTTRAASPLRQRMLEDMRMRKLAGKTQAAYVRALYRLVAFLQRSPDTASAEDLRRFQLDMVDGGASPITVNATITGLKFFFDVTLNHPELMAKIAQIDLFYMQHFARFLTKLDQTKDVDGNSILHNSMIVYGGGNADGNRHTHDNLPVILAGGGGGSLTPGRYVPMGGKPMSNLFLSMADRMGATGVQRIGDSTGRLQGV